MSEDKRYNRERFNEMKEALALSNDDIARIVGLKPGTVKNQVSPYSKKVSTWMRVFIYMYDRQKKLEDENTQTDALNRKLIQDNKRSIMRNATKAKVPKKEEA